ncbi:hypothetical protein NADFUDRAFT_81178 [Nadsonia fulvescens var. elongata DSM 6958]|uniref:Uncharacterized protein n=1 Tax=Nadsonia fulvescens var. elongata DSM 6958 TaxID=857566 RepID=A0A1E3PRS3_9ASCO|nr:hypothetical protein NADFUDRAFT_81178 [Nadsonia fulvescens var. elongata DSM 6958]
MSEPINANPEVMDASALPTRLEKNSKTTSNVLNLLPTSIAPISLFRFGSSIGWDDLNIDKMNISSSPAPSLVYDNADSDMESVNSSSPESEYEPIDSQEIYDLIATISDPEHPLSLGQLSVVNLPHIQVIDSGNPDEMAEVLVEITPTITHCSLATLIGLGLRVRLERCLPSRYRITIKVRAGTHQSEIQVNKQLNDKERVAAACENEQLLGVISNMLATCK